MTLTDEQAVEIEKFIKNNHYTFSIKDVLDEYKKFKNFDYVSHSFKRVFENFSQIFTR